MGSYDKPQTDLQEGKCVKGSSGRFRVILYKKNGNQMRKSACWWNISFLKVFFWLHEITVQIFLSSYF
jgi:hypothetical protein